MCLGVVVLLACWLVAYVFIAGAALGAFSLWLLLGIPLALGLLVLGGLLVFAFMAEVAPADDSILYAVGGVGSRPSATNTAT